MTTLYQRLRETDPVRFEELKRKNRENSRQWREEHPQQTKQYMKKYMKKYREDPENCERIRKRAYDWSHTNYKRFLLGCARQRAKKGNLEFSITEADIVIPMVCPIYKVPLIIPEKGYNNPNSPSVDRIDSKQGYVPGNIQVISLRANKHKSDATPNELLMLAEWAKQLL